MPTPTMAEMLKRHPADSRDKGPLVDRASMFPLGQYADGSLTLAWPGIVKDTYDSLVNSYGDVAAGRTPRTQDVLNVASAPMMGNFAARAIREIPQATVRSGYSLQRGPTSHRHIHQF